MMLRGEAALTLKGLAPGPTFDVFGEPANQKYNDPAFNGLRNLCYGPPVDDLSGLRIGIEDR